MPNRYLREEIITSERIAQLSWGAEVFYRRLMSRVDDYGRFEAHPALLRAALYPLQLDQVSEQHIIQWLAECGQMRAQGAQKPLLLQYTVGLKNYLEIQDFNQRIRSLSKFPDPLGARMHAARGQSVGICPPTAAVNETVCEFEDVHDTSEEPARSSSAPSQDSSSATQAQLLRLALEGYVKGKGWNPPDDKLIYSVLKAGNGATAVEIHQFLRDRYFGGQGPRDSSGPRSWGWFVTVVRNHFVRLKQPKSGDIDDCKK